MDSSGHISRTTTIFHLSEHNFCKRPKTVQQVPSFYQSGVGSVYVEACLKESRSSAIVCLKLTHMWPLKPTITGVKMVGCLWQTRALSDPRVSFFFHLFWRWCGDLFIVKLAHVVPQDKDLNLNRFSSSCQQNQDVLNINWSQYFQLSKTYCVCLSVCVWSCRSERWRGQKKWVIPQRIYTHRFQGSFTSFSKIQTTAQKMLFIENVIN